MKVRGHRVERAIKANLEWIRSYGFYFLDRIDRINRIKRPSAEGGRMTEDGVQKIRSSEAQKIRRKEDIDRSTEVIKSEVSQL